MIVAQIGQAIDRQPAQTMAADQYVLATQALGTGERSDFAQ